MTGVESLFEEARRLATQDASIPALRGILFLSGVFAAFAWLKRRPGLARILVAGGGVVGLCYWLIQVDSPLGLGTDARLTDQWAQAGVDSLAEPKGGGFVWGTPAERSLVAALASLGAPLPMVHATPQIAALLCLAFVALLPSALLRNPATAAFAASLALGGGLWPGLSPYGSALREPGMLLGTAAVLASVTASAQRRGVRLWFRRSRFAATIALITAATLGHAWSGGAEPGVVSSFALMGASVALASPLRVLLRRLSRTPSTGRWMEALVLLSVFSGSGLFWWNPAKALPGFAEARDGGANFRAALGWVARHVPQGDVVLASPAYSAPIAAFAGRRVLFSPVGEGMALSEPFRRARLNESTRKGQPIARLADAFSVTHLFLGPGEATPPSPDPEGGSPPDEPRLSLLLVYQDTEDFRVFRLARK